jgi:endoglucanase
MGVALSVLFLVLVALGPAQTTSVPPSHLANLSHGVNVGRFLNGKFENDSIKCCEMSDIDYMQRIGFDHIRVLVEPGDMFDFNKRGLISGPSLDALDKLVHNCVSRQNGRKPVAIILAITLDEFTSEQKPRFRNKLTDLNSNFVPELADFWQGLAHHYSTSDYPSDFVFFEVLNEPGQNEPLSGPGSDQQWASIQATLAGAIRRGASDNTILATGAEKSDVFGLLALPQLLHDSNVIYVFHYYEPYSFTHQGETWNPNWAQFLKPGDVKYPYTPESVKNAAGSVQDLTDRLYASHDMELAIQNRLEVDIEAIAEWKRRTGVPVTCDEFGVITNAKAADRARWLKDVKKLLENEKIGWTVWDYSSQSFGLLADANQFDKDAAEALGLKVGP